MLICFNTFLLFYFYCPSFSKTFFVLIKQQRLVCLVWSVYWVCDWERELNSGLTGAEEVCFLFSGNSRQLASPNVALLPSSGFIWPLFSHDSD